uniref:glycerol-3-phosphate dehydrogenase n=1 Tax=Rhodosorus marinus TaxID=101924 RepID=A0A7S3AB39_9RHOD|mmetsp:Transcript_9988/g.42140  ORF Transcript_9988/g.42140 Transcript_9988/m.42140 type:complete len:631 (+) Transcript_9988:260-2152(+)|eukprot:CAMPEP_0113958090 /NCGR_PEP_ID=MMETSP0011_2-20120614/3152_1 /TAXON_ID=101924 /ORGANISM="Rhodosorus marinus" /LENGTH=630 /DNA_ID=CAMNT_0000968765 /DNA_START=120 /DNA_END=2012 /DNA_ORIENTATION=+ /assembly_acc=CAM_ASM_000156
MKFRHVLLRALGGVGAAIGLGSIGGCAYLYASSYRYNRLEDGFEVDAPLLERPPSREDQISKLKSGEHYDVLVIGGNALGSGVALDCALRGLKVALVEDDDFASSSTSPSSFGIGGGFQYIRRAYRNADPTQISSLVSWIHEKHLMTKQAPHLAEVMPVAVPCYSFREVVGNWFKDTAVDSIATSMRSSIGSSRFVSASEIQRMFPTFARKTSRGKTLRGSILREEVVPDEARFVSSLALTAALHGATVANHVEVKQLILDDEKRALGAMVEDTETQQNIKVNASFVVNAMDASLESSIRLYGELETDSDIINDVRTRKKCGTALARYYSPENACMIIPSVENAPPVAVMSWQGSAAAETIIQDGPTPDVPEDAEVRDFDDIVTAVSDVLSLDVRQQDLKSVWKSEHSFVSERYGRRRKKEALSPVHRINVTNNVISSVGGHWSDYRLRACEVVDTLLEMDDSLKRGSESECRTEFVKLLGSDEWDPSSFAFIMRDFEEVQIPTTKGRRVVMETSRMEESVARRLASAYGDQAYRVGRLAAQGFGRKILPDHSVMEAELVYCVQNEMAMTVLDFLARRTRLAYLDPKECLEALPQIVQLMGEQLSWTAARREAELKATTDFLKSISPPAE